MKGLHARWSAHSAHPRHSSLHCHFLENDLLVFKEKQVDWQQVHEAHAGSIPHDFATESFDDVEQLVNSIDALIQLIALVILDQLGDWSGFLSFCWLRGSWHTLNWHSLTHGV